MKKLTIAQEVKLEGKIYKVIGIDHYKLKNLLDGVKEWDSYTLIDDQGDKTWVSYGAIKDYYLHWKLVSAKEFTQGLKFPPNPELTDIANVTFQGNPGYSTPTAEIVWVNLANQKYDYFVYERFLKQVGNEIEALESYYDAGKILKDFII